VKTKTTSINITLLVAGLLAAFAGASWAAEVKENWEKHCQKCHGADGKGQTKMGRQSGVKDYTDPKVQAELKDDNGVKIIKEGIVEKDKKKMDPYEKNSQHRSLSCHRHRLPGCGGCKGELGKALRLVSRQRR